MRQLFFIAASAATLLAASPQTPSASPPVQAAAAIETQVEAQRAARISQELEANGQTLTMFDRQGNVVATIGERGFYRTPVFSPDRTHLAVMSRDLQEGTWDLWVLDVATGRSTRITTTPALPFREGEVWSPVWSPDGRDLVYMSRRLGYEGFYRKASTGEGTERLLHEHPGNGISLTGWSTDARFVNFSTANISGGILYALPLDGRGATEPAAVLKSKFPLGNSRLSPDSRLLSYTSDESGAAELYVRRFDPSTVTLAAQEMRVSGEGARGGGFWRRDGMELYFVAPDGRLMAAKIGSEPALAFDPPEALFRLPEGIASNGLDVSRDGERVVAVVPPPQSSRLQQIFVFDRQGNVLHTVGEPGHHFTPILSGDGARVVSLRNGEAGEEIWTFDLASGESHRVTDDRWPRNDYPLWAPDGASVLYVSTRGDLAGVYRKAWDGSGSEELLFQFTPGAPIFLSDITSDGRFLVFYSSGYILAVPLKLQQDVLDRVAIDLIREETEARSGQVSGDSRFIAYNGGGVKVRPFVPGAPESEAARAETVQVSDGGFIGWRRDKGELYYRQRDRETDDELVMAVDVSTTPAFEVGVPRLLFRIPANRINPSGWGSKMSASADGQRFVVNLNVIVSGEPTLRSLKQ